MEGRDPEGKLLPPEDRLLQAILDLEPAHEKVFFLSQLPIRTRLDRLTVELELPDTTEDERIALFRAFLGDTPLEDGLTAEELACKFRFSPQAGGAGLPPGGGADEAGRPGGHPQPGDAPVLLPAGGA